MSTQESLTQQSTLTPAITAVLATQIVSLSQSVSNFAFHVPPQASRDFIPFIREMNQAFESREMRKTGGKGKKPD